MPGSLLGQAGGQRQSFHYSMDWRRWLRNCKSNPGLLSTASAVNQAIRVFGWSVYIRFTVQDNRSALSMTLKPIDGVKVGEHPLIRRLI